MEDYARHYEAIKQLHRSYYQARLMKNMDEACVLALQIVEQAQHLSMITVQETLEEYHVVKK